LEENAVTSFISREEKHAPGFKAAKDGLTLIIGGNASGDLKLKPLLIYHSQTPRAMRGYSKEHMPVIWRSNPKHGETGHFSGMVHKRILSRSEVLL
jgi:hypothetical protein